MRILQLALLATALTSATSACAPGKTAESAPVSYTVIDGRASQLRADFNRKVGTIRLLFVVDPICPGCLRGLADMNRDLLRGTTDPRLQVFVVHEPVLGVARYIPWLRIAGGRDAQRRRSSSRIPTFITIGTAPVRSVECSRGALGSRILTARSMPGMCG